MNNVIAFERPQTATGAMCFAIGAAMVAGQPAWPVRETPTYMVTQTAPSYSHVTERVFVAAKQPAHAGFARDVAAIFAALSERQERLGEEFEAAIFSDLDSLYES